MGEDNQRGVQKTDDSPLPRAAHAAGGDRRAMLVCVGINGM